MNKTYNISAKNKLQNIDVVKTAHSALDEIVSSELNSINKYGQLNTNVADREGHDARYAIDATKIANELDWTSDERFAMDIKKTVEWCLDNKPWCQHLENCSYKRMFRNIS